MNNTISPIAFQKRFKTSGKKSEAGKQSVVGAIKEEDVKNIIQKTTTPGIRKAILGVASFLAVMFATKRLAVQPTRWLTYRIFPKTEQAVENFTKNARPFLAEIGSRLKLQTKNFLNGEKFADFAKKITKNENLASKLVSKTYKATKYLGTKLANAAKWGLKNPDKVIDYTLAGSVALLSSKGIIKLDNLSSKKKLETLFGDNDGKDKE